MNKADLVNEVTKVVSTKKKAQAEVDCVFESGKNYPAVGFFVERYPLWGPIGPNT